MVEERANIRNLREEEEVRQKTLPHMLGTGLRRAAGAAIPAATSVLDVTTLPPRALGHGVAEVFRGVTGTPSQPFQRAPLTAAASRIMQPSPVELEQRGLIPPTEPAPDAGFRRPSPITSPMELPTEPAPGAGFRRPSPITPEITPSPVPYTGQIGPGVYRHITTDPETGGEFAQTFIQGGSQLYSPRELMERRGVMETEELAGKVAERGLRTAKTALAEKQLETANLVKTNVEVPSGQFDQYGEPIMVKRQILYNPETREVVDPTMMPRQAAAPTTLRSAYDKLSETNRGIVEKYFEDRVDVTPEEVLTFIGTLSK